MSPPQATTSAPSVTVATPSVTVGASLGPTSVASQSASTTATVPGPATEISHGPRDRPQVALTFHGAGDVRLARQILQVAKDHQARITVMVIGTWLSDNPAIAAEILDGGHQLGNHTWSHLDINAMTEAEMTVEVTRCRDLLIQTAGTPGAFFRPSQAQTASTLMKQVAGAAGYAVSLSYDLDSMDWTDPGAATVRRYTAAAQPGSIVSMHLGHQSTVDALPDVLDDLAARGLTPVTADTLLAP